MRTPLTHLRYSLERARHGASTKEQYDAAIDAAISESDEILGIFAALLRIAQIEAGAQRSGFQTVDLAHVLRRAHDIYRPVMDDEGAVFRRRRGGSTAGIRRSASNCCSR